MSFSAKQRFPYTICATIKTNVSCMDPVTLVSVMSDCMQNDYCYGECRNEVRVEGPRMCFAGTAPSEKKTGEEGRERENERAEESRRKEINTDSE